MTLAYLNNQYIDLKDAKVSVLDRGFLFGDGVYEVIPVYSGCAVGLDQHLTRLNNSLKNIYMKPALSKNQWLEIFQTLANNISLENQSNYQLYIQVTRGEVPVRNHTIPENYQATVFVTTFPIQRAASNIKNGISARTITDTRWSGCHTKAITLLPNVLAKTNAQQQEAQDGIFVKNNYALEGTSSNLFIAKSGIVKTTPLTENILPGITRSIVLEILSKLKINHKEELISIDELLQADEVWITSSTQEITAVTSIDNKTIGTGKPGSLWEQVYAQYQKQKQCVAQLAKNTE